MEVFRLHWLDGKVEIVRGEGIANAFNKAGYGGGAIRALDYYEEVSKSGNTNGAAFGKEEKHGRSAGIYDS